MRNLVYDCYYKGTLLHTVADFYTATKWKSEDSKRTIKVRLENAKEEEEEKERLKRLERIKKRQEAIRNS